MFEPSKELVVEATPSHLLNNFSLYYHEAKFTTHAVYCSRAQVELMTWDTKMEKLSTETILLKECGVEDGVLLQAKLCMPTNRTSPVLVVVSTVNITILDIRNNKILITHPPDKKASGEKEDLATVLHIQFGRGISCVENFILVGSFSGEVFVFQCTGENAFQIKKSITEHKEPIIDIATCMFDLITATVDVAGNVVVWAKNMKTIVKKISTGQAISVVNVLRKQVICGTFLGQILLYSVQTGNLMAEANAHARQITAISVAPESAYVLTASEDCYVRVWKLHTRKPEAYQLEYRHSELIKNQSIMGANFTNPRGSGFVVSLYEYNKLPYYKIAKKGPAPETNAAT
ncbi:WD40 repeat [Aphelenchoides avenae]|nr:WD40 repeat [Aphelenchus avenae]